MRKIHFIAMGGAAMHNLALAMNENPDYKVSGSDDEFFEPSKSRLAAKDLLPDKLITKTLNYETKNISTASIDGLSECCSKVEFLEEFFKHRGLHDFKKAEFAQDVKNNINSADDISEEIREIIKEIKGTKVPF